MDFQQTIKEIVRCSGIGLHSGKMVNLRFVPAPIDTGIVFLRKTVRGMVPVKVDGTRVVATLLSTTIGGNGVKIQTVEHLLAALAGLRITNLIIELDSDELPIMDGSSSPFVDLILKAGTLQQSARQPVLKITRPIEVREAEKWIRIRPASTFAVDCTIRFNHPLLSHQRYRYDDSPEEFARWIAPARTFGFLNEVEVLRNRGLALGGSLENAVVIGPDGIMNPEGLRYSDEFVRHKVLDLIGDLSLLGVPVLGRVEAFCAGHHLNTKLVSTILSRPDAWMILSDRRPAAQAAAASPMTTSV